MLRIALMETNYSLAVAEKSLRDWCMDSEKGSGFDSLYRAGIFVVLGGRRLKRFGGKLN